MGAISHLFYPWSLILQVLAVIHFARRRPDRYWLYVIVFLGPIGAVAYLVAEALPDIQLLGASFKKISRGRRIKALEITIRDNPSPGNLEELGELYMEDSKLQLARDAFSKAISARSYSLDTLYHRAICAIQLGDAAGAVPDLEQVIAKDPSHDFNRGAGLLALAYALVGQKEQAEAMFRKAIVASTLSETYLNFADLLASEGRNAEAREWAQKVLDKGPTMPHYLRRRERPWFRRARKILKQVPT